MRSRMLVALAAACLAGVLFFPLWTVRLTAPQYPEGLGMRIRVNTVEGAKENDLTNINNLNHYIGMKVIDPNVIPELRYMPWLVGALAAGALGVGVAGKRRALFAWLGAFALFAACGLADFWRWEYDYGHNLDVAHAVIKIPGMTYQPPLIGSKQLLNFTATAWPASGGVLLGVAFVLGAGAVVLTVRTQQRLQMNTGEHGSNRSFSSRLSKHSVSGVANA